ncbi:hypothetical protein [Sorangium sp. So ce124]|uniref:hypothetical protein n=1 Tax=Sorangium sp. So ce124 TaxID=3133280 RepID=UPI003F620B8C
MVRDLGLRRALRKLDRIPAGPALAAGLGAGAALGFVCLREPSAAGIAGFVALVAAAVPLAISARPIAVPAQGPAGEGARPTLGGRLKAALNSGAALPALVLAGLLGVVVWRELRARSAPDIPLMPAPPETATATVHDRAGAPTEPRIPAPASSATGTAKFPISPPSSSPREPKATTPQPPPRAGAEP